MSPIPVISEKLCSVLFASVLTADRSIAYLVDTDPGVDDVLAMQVLLGPHWISC